jgi:hypothetical protein
VKRGRTGEVFLEGTEAAAIEERREPPAKARPGITKIHAAVLVIIVSTMSSVATVAVYDRWVAQKVVAVDVSGFLQEQRDLVLGKKITMDDFKANLDRYLAALKSQPKNRVLILEDVIASKNLEKVSY